MATRASFGKLSLTIPTIIYASLLLWPGPVGTEPRCEYEGGRRQRNLPRTRLHRGPVKKAGRHHRRRMLSLSFTK